MQCSNTLYLCQHHADIKFEYIFHAQKTSPLNRILKPIPSLPNWRTFYKKGTDVEILFNSE